MVSQVEIIKISPELHRNKHIPSFSYNGYLIMGMIDS